MKKFSVSYLKTAQKDLFQMFEYIAKDKPQSAAKYIEKLDKTISHLEANPELGIIPKDDRLQKSGYRILIFESYLIFYVVKKTTIQIRRIVHGTRRYEFLV